MAQVMWGRFESFVGTVFELVVAIGLISTPEDAGQIANWLSDRGAAAAVLRRNGMRGRALAFIVLALIIYRIWGGDFTVGQIGRHNLYGDGGSRVV
jgi:hypothetical protein